MTLGARRRPRSCRGRGATSRSRHALLTKWATIAGTIESDAQRDRGQPDAQHGRRDEAPDVGVEQPEQDAGEQRRAQRREPAQQATQDRPAEQRLLAHRGRHRHQQERQHEAAPALGRRDRRGAGCRSPAWAPAAAIRPATPPPATPTARTGSRPPAPRRRPPQAKHLAQRAPAAARVGHGQAEQADPLESPRCPGPAATFAAARTRTGISARDREQGERRAPRS